MHRVSLALIGVLVAFAGAALADDPAPLTDADVTSFISTLDAANAFGDELDADGKTDALEVAMEPKPGEAFKPYSNAVAAMKTKYPTDYVRLGAIVSPLGFSADNWAATGDRVISAYFAVRMERDNPGAAAQMAAMDPALLARLPAAHRADFEALKALVATSAAVSPEDRAAVEPHMDALDAEMDD